MTNSFYTIYKKTGYHIRRIGIDMTSRFLRNNWLLNDRPGKCILLYHGIDLIGQTSINSRFISAQLFAQQLDFLQKHYHLVSLSDLVSDKIDPDRMNIAIVFDDGYRNNLQLALPILEKRQIHATFFVTAINHTQYSMLWADYLDLASNLSHAKITVGGDEYNKKNGVYKNVHGVSLKTMCKTHDWSFKKKIYTSFPKVEGLSQLEEWEIYWKTLSDEEIIKLDKSKYASVELHGYYHENLDVCSHTEAVRLITMAKHYLENLLQREVQSIAFPDGAYTRDLIQSCFEMGFKKQYAVDYLFPEDKTDPRIHSRLTINPFTNLSHQVWAILNNKY